MLKKLILASALIALPLMFSQQEATAGGGIRISLGSPGYGHGHGHGHGYRAVTPYQSAYRGYSRAVTPYSHNGYSSGYGGGYYGPVGTRYRGGNVYGGGYGSGYGGGGAYCPSGGYGGGYNRGGVSLRFGF